MDLPDSHLSEHFGPLQKLPVVRLPKKRRKFGETGEYSDVDRVLKQIVEDAYRYVKSVTPVSQQKNGLPSPDPHKYTSFSRLKGPIINKLAEKLLVEPEMPKAKLKAGPRILPQWKGGIYKEPDGSASCKVYDHTDVSGCSTAAVTSEELCLFCKEDSLGDAEESYAFHNTLKYGSVDGSIVHSLPTAYRAGYDSTKFAEKDRLAEVKTTARTKALRIKRQLELPPLEFGQKINMKDFMLPASIFIELGRPVPEEVKAYWSQTGDVTAKLKDPTMSEESLFPTPSLTASETSEYRSEDVSMAEMEKEAVLVEVAIKTEPVSTEEDDEEMFTAMEEHPESAPIPIASSSPLPTDEMMETAAKLHSQSSLGLRAPEELVEELKKCYEGVPPESIVSFHDDFIEKLERLRDSLLEQRETELAAASVCFQDPEDNEEGVEQPYEEVDEPMELEHGEDEEKEQAEVSPILSTIAETPQPRCHFFSEISDTTEEDLEEFAEFFPDYPSRLSSGVGFNDSPPPAVVLRRPSDEDVDVVGVEEQQTAGTSAISPPSNTNEALNSSHPSWYSDSDPSTSFNCSPELSSENNLTIEVVSPTKTAATETWTCDRQSNLIIRSSYSSDDEVYDKYSYNARFSPVTDAGHMPSPIASQQ